MDDITKPGKTPASATSRPIIIGRGPAVQDPMVNNETSGLNQEASDKTPEKLSAPSVVKKVISPITAPEAEKPETTAEATSGSSADSAVVDAVLDQVSDKKKQEQLSEEENKRSELIEKLVVEKKYFVPTKGPHQKRNNRIAFLLLIVLLVGVGGVVAAIDAGVLDIGITLPFDLIKQ